MAVDRVRNLTLLSKFIYFNMQHISLIIQLIYVLKHTLVFLYILIYYNPTFINISKHALCSPLMVVTLESISFLMPFLNPVRRM